MKSRACFAGLSHEHSVDVVCTAIALHSLTMLEVRRQLESASVGDDVRTFARRVTQGHVTDAKAIYTKLTQYLARMTGPEAWLLASTTVSIVISDAPAEAVRAAVALFTMSDDTGLSGLVYSVAADIIEEREAAMRTAFES